MKSLLFGFAMMMISAAAPAQQVAISERTGEDGTLSMTHELVVPAPAAEIWSAISTAEGWRTWAVPVAWMTGGELETSYAPNARPGDGTTIRQILTVARPGRALSFRTIKAPDGFPHFDLFQRVTHLFELEEVGGHETLVRLTGRGYADTPAGRQLLGFFREGNRISMERLHRRFLSGPLDWSRTPDPEMPDN